LGCSSKPDPPDLLQSSRRCPAITRLEACSRSTSHYMDPSDLPGHGNTGDWCSRAGRGQIVLATNRNGGMLRLIAPRHDEVLRWFVSKIIKLCLNLSKLCLEYCGLFFFWKRYILCKNLTFTLAFGNRKGIEHVKGVYTKTAHKFSICSKWPVQTAHSYIQNRPLTKAVYKSCQALY